MNRHVLLKILLFLLLGLAASNAHALVALTDHLSVSGYARYEIGLHMAESNPNLDENHDLSLSKFFFQAEWTYQPTDIFKLYAITRVLGDTTQHWDGDLDDYNAFPIDVPDYDWTMMKVGEDDWRAEVWELYADLTLGNLWVRAGKQQIAWGEMINSRILDIINPLDLSWNFQFEPEEFEIIRIPNWSIRAIYSLADVSPVWFYNSSIEAFVTPGDVLPNQNADVGAPFNLVTLPPFLRVNERDNRGKTEYGFRLGGMVGDFYGTLNYMSLYNDDFNLDFTGLAPDPVFGIPVLAPGDMTPYALLLNAEYKKIDVYGVSLNYAWAQPLNLVATFEGTWIPNQPYGDAESATPAIKDQGTWKYAVRFDRNTQVLPPKFLHASYMMIQLQFTQTIVEGDEDKILGPADSRMDKTVENYILFLQQPILYNNVTLGLLSIWDPDGAYYFKPSFKYTHGDHWYFDVFATFLGGSEKRAGRFGSLYWADTLYGRITYQF